MILFRVQSNERERDIIGTLVDSAQETNAALSHRRKQLDQAGDMVS